MVPFSFVVIISFKKNRMNSKLRLYKDLLRFAQSLQLSDGFYVSSRIREEFKAQSRIMDSNLQSRAVKVSSVVFFKILERNSLS